MQGNPRDAPWWVTPLVLAEKWGMPPWEIMRARGSMVWATRQGALDDARAWKAKWDAQKNK